jgi:acyl-CoA thioester hydrolase
MGRPFRHELRVRFNECDPQGIVFNANYLVYLDVAFSEMFRAVAGSYVAFVEAGTDLVLAESRVVYRVPARFDDLVAVELTPGHFGTTSMRVDARILRDDDTLLAEGELRYVAVDPATHTKKPVDAAREALEPYIP